MVNRRDVGQDFGVACMVLFVDDEESVLTALKRLFKREQYPCRFASSGSQALEMLAGNADVGVIVSGQRMPGMGGTEFLIRSRQNAPNATRMILTGHWSMESTREAMNEGGANRYIYKPWDNEDLLQIIREAVEQYVQQHTGNQKPLTRRLGSP